MRSRATLLVVGCAVAAAALLTWAPARDPDLWWHLATGRAILATRSTLPVDPFSFSFAGAPWRYKDVVADALLWALFARGGFGGLLLFRIGCAAILALGVRLVTRAALPSLVALAVVLVLPWADRPMMLSLALFPTVLALCERRRFGWLVAVTWLGIVLHRAALLCYAIVAARAAHLVLARLCARWPRLSIVAGAPPSSRTLAWAVAAALAAPLVGLANPQGAAAFTTVFDVAGSRMMRTYIAEFRALGPAALWSWSGAFAAVAAIAIVARLVVAVRRRERAPVDAWHLGLLVLFGALATHSLRYLPYLALAGALPLALVVDEAMPRLRAPRALTALAAVALCALAVVARRGAPFALGPDERVVPVAAVDFATAHGLDGPVLDSFEFGGYLLYRGVPVLVDGRLDTIYPPPFVALCIQAERKPALLERLPLDDVGWALGSNGEQRWTHRYLFSDPKWAEIFWSEAASVYVRRDRHPELLPLAFATIDPAAPELAAANAVRSGDRSRIAQARDELQRMLAASPTSVRANRALAIYFHLLGRNVERDTVMRALDPEDAAELRKRFSAAATAN
jgi:branched-subunit amino acid transport protein AzlD